MKYQDRQTLMLDEIRHYLLQSQVSGSENKQSVILTPNKIDRLYQKSWNLKWHLYSESIQEKFLSQLPKWIGFYTSGHTQKPTLWLREIKQLLKEVEILSKVCQTNKIDGVITFAPIHHLYGFLFSLLLPAINKVPVWFCPMNAPGSLSYPELRNPLFVTIPSALNYMKRRVQDFDQYNSITIVHSTALLPATALQLSEKLKHKKLNFVELFGSTETGLIAVRKPKSEVEIPWELVSDVTFANVHLHREGFLEIYSPRIASNSKHMRPTSWRLNDFVEVLSPKTFLFKGRKSRLLKINGQRINLDRVEKAVRQAIACRDLACVPVRDDIRSERFDLFLVCDSQKITTTEQIRSMCKKILSKAEQPRRVVLTPKLKRTSTGKLSWQNKLSV
ncbi:MAG: hypothetical protein F6K45_19210 [Kamptonema sp. SIO1D9]|nr:hypothetical protein [Kamptonema sp. SIO1D9]